MIVIIRLFQLMSLPVEDLQKLPMFESLTSDQLNNLLNHSQSYTLKKGQVLFSMGKRSNHFYYLHSGQIKISRSTRQGQEKVLTIVHPGQLFAEVVMFMDTGLFPANAEALEPSEVIGFENQIFTGFLQESPCLSMATLGNLTKKLHKQIIEIESLTMQNANYRIVNFIDTLIPSETNSPVEVELPGPKSTIASRLSITPETLSRGLHYLSEKNLINLQGTSRRIEIPDIAKFKQYLLSN